MRIEVAVYDPERKPLGQSKFECGNAHIDKFARDRMAKQVRQGLSVAYVLLDRDDNDRMAGFYTLAHHSIPMEDLSALGLGSLPRAIPCVRVGMLGVGLAFQGAGLGRQLMASALSDAKRAGEIAGCFGVYLDADPSAVAFYKKLGFVLLQGDQSPAHSPMFLRMASIP